MLVQHHLHSIEQYLAGDEPSSPCSCRELVAIVALRSADEIAKLVLDDDGNKRGRTDVEDYECACGSANHKSSFALAKTDEPIVWLPLRRLGATVDNAKEPRANKQKQAVLVRYGNVHGTFQYQLNMRASVGQAGLCSCGNMMPELTTSMKQCAPS